MTSTARTWALAALTCLLSTACNDGSGGDCDPPCGDTQACCDGTCVFTISSPTNCGTCGNVCTSGVCVNGMCAPGTDGGPPSMCQPNCPVTLRCCGTSCVNRAVNTGTDGRTDPSFDNCNGCGIACDMDRANSCSVPGNAPGGTARCMCGDFDQCLAGEVCLNTGGVYGCTSLSTDPMNCGAVGNACAEGESCSGGMCVCGGTGARCETGQACCAGACIDTQSDAMNCGACGQTCTPNAPNCQAGACTCAASGRACDAPVAGNPLAFPPEPSDLGESCCPGTGCVANTDTSCGCMACTGSDECSVGGTTIPLPGLPGGGEEDFDTVCCLDPDDFLGTLLGCDGFPFPIGDGGLPFPGGDGGFTLPFDGGFTIPGDDAGTTPTLDAGVGMDGGT